MPDITKGMLVKVKENRGQPGMAKVLRVDGQDATIQYIADGKTDRFSVGLLHRDLECVRTTMAAKASEAAAIGTSQPRPGRR